MSASPSGRGQIETEPGRQGVKGKGGGGAFVDVDSSQRADAPPSALPWPGGNPGITSAIDTFMARSRFYASAQREGGRGGGSPSGPTVRICREGTLCPASMNEQQYGCLSEEACLFTAG